jgi:hypothetical protein
MLGVALSGMAVIMLWLATNWLAAALLAFTILFYAVIYSMWLKRATPQNIVIGGAAGAFPPMIGWVAVTGSISLEACLMFMLIFMWTPPHFWALALFMKGDYHKANVPMLTVTHGRKATRAHILVYTIALGALCTGGGGDQHWRPALSGDGRGLNAIFLHGAWPSGGVTRRRRRPIITRRKTRVQVFPGSIWRAFRGTSGRTALGPPAGLCRIRFDHIRHSGGVLMAITREHELHKRRSGRNIGLALVLVAFGIALVFGLTIAKVSGGGAIEAFDHSYRPARPQRCEVSAKMIAPGTKLTGIQKTTVQTVGVVLFMGAMGWAAVPLYDLFCRVTGYGGTTARAESSAMWCWTRRCACASMRLSRAISRGSSSPWTA